MDAFYFDHGVSEQMAALLDRKGHDILSTQDRGQTRASDDQQLLTAYQLGRILVTHNAGDFRLVHYAWRLWPGALGLEWPPHPGILVIPQPPELSIERAAEELDKFVRSGRRIVNELYRLRVPGGWQRER